MWKTEIFLKVWARTWGFAGFSKIAFDQKHEMNNKAIKSRNGYINLVNAKDSSFLRKIEVCSAEVHNLLEDFDDIERSSKHKEES